MADGFDKIVTPENTSEWEELVAAVRAHHNGNASRTLAVAGILRRELPHAQNVSGRRGMAGLDLRLGAIQVARQLHQAAAADTACAAAWSKADAFFHGTFAPNSGSSRGRRFDAGK